MANPKKYGNSLYYFECIKPGLIDDFSAFAGGWLTGCLEISLPFGDCAAKFLEEHPDLKIVTMQSMVIDGTCVGYWVVVDRK